MPDSHSEQITHLTQSIDDLEAQQHETGIDLSAAIAALRGVRADLQAAITPPINAVSGGILAQADKLDIGGDAVARDKINARTVIVAGERDRFAAGMIYKNSDSSDFSTRFKQLFRQAKRSVMIGTGLNILHSESLREALAERLQENCHVEIYAANPFSPNVQTRLIEEEIGVPAPRIRKAGLVNWLGDLLAMRDKLADKSKLDLRLFPFYPTYALFIFDDRDYFVYPYGYTQLGTLSPVLHYTVKNEAHDAMTNFLQGQYERIKKYSVEAEPIFNLRNLRAGKKVKPSDLTAFAVYLVPPAASRLYDFGSQVLEYDVRAQKVLEQHGDEERHNAIGAAADFGFHLTVADALYCVNEEELRLISEEVKFVARGVQSFTLSFSIKKDFPNSQGIALVCQDKSGTLEALHHEMVARVYRKAVASNYSLGLALPDRDPDRERANLMIERYYAPYILQRFKPHFSLLSNVPADETKKNKIYQDLKELFEKSVPNPSIKVQSIAVMHRPDPAGRWEIHEEYHLGGEL